MESVLSVDACPDCRAVMLKSSSRMRATSVNREIEGSLRALPLLRSVTMVKGACESLASWSRIPRTTEVAEDDATVGSMGRGGKELDYKF